jgi:hypothetical protein
MCENQIWKHVKSFDIEFKNYMNVSNVTWTRFLNLKILYTKSLFLKYFW